MRNISDISLSEEKVSLRKKINSIRRSMEALKNKDSEYYEHHQHLINTYNEMVEIINAAIIESNDIGKGV